MIRINLLPGQQRPKAKRAAVAAPGMQSILLGVGAIAGLLVLGGMYFLKAGELKEAESVLARQQAEKARLEKVKLEVDDMQSRMRVLELRSETIRTLQRNRVGGQQLLDALATTVNRSESVWLTLLSRKGNVLSIEGTASSVSAVANLITQLKRAGYFDKVEIRESRQDDKQKAIQVFNFVITAEFALPAEKPAEGAAAEKKG